MSTLMRDLAEKNPSTKREVDHLLLECQIRDIHADEMMTFHLVVMRVLIYLMRRLDG